MGIIVIKLIINVYLLHFFHLVDLRRLLDSGPWSFDGHLLILHHLQPEETPTSTPLYYVSFWVQVYEFPMGFMSTGVGEQLRNYLDKYMEYNGKNNLGMWRNFMRIGALLDVRVLLKWKKKMRMANGAWAMISFKYERLGSFYFLCDLLDIQNSSVGNYLRCPMEFWHRNGVCGFEPHHDDKVVLVVKSGFGKKAKFSYWIQLWLSLYGSSGCKPAIPL